MNLNSLSVDCPNCREDSLEVELTQAGTALLRDVFDGNVSLRDLRQERLSALESSENYRDSRMECSRCNFRTTTGEFLSSHTNSGS